MRAGQFVVFYNPPLKSVNDNDLDPKQMNVKTIQLNFIIEH